MTPTPEQVAVWAREAGSTPYTNRHFEGRTYNAFSPEQLHRLVTIAMAAQAEADAKLCGQVGARDTEFEAYDCAATIRANAPKMTTCPQQSTR